MKKGILLPVLAIVIMAGLVLGLTLGINGLAVKNAQAEHLWLMQTLLPGSESFTVEPYSGEDANIRSVHKAENGFVIETVTYGYAGEITMLIGVSNEGEVIPPEELPLVFDRFHKTDKSRSQNRDSWGLGLYIVRTLIDSHGENISVTSRDGTTTFTFTLPLVN